MGNDTPPVTCNTYAAAISLSNPLPLKCSLLPNLSNQPIIPYATGPSSLPLLSRRPAILPTHPPTSSRTRDLSVPKASRNVRLRTDSKHAKVAQYSHPSLQPRKSDSSYSSPVCHDSTKGTIYPTRADPTNETPATSLQLSISHPTNRPSHARPILPPTSLPARKRGSWAQSSSSSSSSS